VRRSATNEFFCLFGQFRTGYHLGYDGGRTKLVGFSPKRGICNPRHRGQKNRRSDLDITDLEHETVSAARSNMPNLWA
jgi:hypothetical protein